MLSAKRFNIYVGTFVLGGFFGSLGGLPALAAGAALGAVLGWIIAEREEHDAVARLEKERGRLQEEGDHLRQAVFAHADAVDVLVGCVMDGDKAIARALERSHESRAGLAQLSGISEALAKSSSSLIEQEHDWEIRKLKLLAVERRKLLEGLALDAPVAPSGRLGP